MQERKRQEKNKPLPELRSSVGEILVANGRVFQPFIRTFQYTGENVSKANLGTLIGVFEIDDQSEDSAYIVNFLASVAKKEYFNNPRRGAIESFEAALHKINLALAELVKHGNIAWLGKFHGALGVLEKNNLHFSVSGHAAILLLRNQTIADIGDGLASDEAHIHPIKTFVEVSSGRLSANDQILMSSPELLALFSMEDLNKQASRMGGERFTQFLKTALVNELDMAGLMVIDIFEGIEPKAPSESVEKTSEAPLRVNNVFSQSAFAAKKNHEIPSVESVLIEKHAAKEEEYIDNKTGHIYVQGDTPQVPETHPIIEVLRLKFDDSVRFVRLFFVAQGKNIRKGKKHVGLFLEDLGEKSTHVGRRMSRALRRHWRRYEEQRAQKRARLAKEKLLSPDPILPPTQPEKAPFVSDIEKPHQDPLPSETPTESPRDPAPSTSSRLALFYQRKDTSIASPTPQAAPSTSTASPHLSARIAPFMTLLHTLARRISQTAASFSLTDSLRPLISFWKKFSRQSRLLLTRSWSAYQALSPKMRLAIPLLLIAIIGSPLFFFSKETAPAPTATLPAPSLTPVEHTLSPLPSGEMTVLARIDALVAPVLLNDEAYAVTEHAVIAVANQTTFPLPTSAKAVFAAGMDDLRLLFITTDDGKLFAWSPISKTFTENTLPLTGASKIAGIGTSPTSMFSIARPIRSIASHEHLVGLAPVPPGSRKLSPLKKQRGLLSMKPFLSLLTQPLSKATSAAERVMPSKHRQAA